MAKRDPFKYFHSSPEIIRLAVMMYVRFPLYINRRNVLSVVQNHDDLLAELACDETGFDAVTAPDGIDIYRNGRY